MTELWAWVLIACGIAYATKMAGYLVPDSVLDRPWVATVSTGMTVGLLTSLVVANTFVTGTAGGIKQTVERIGAALGNAMIVGIFFAFVSTGYPGAFVAAYAAVTACVIAAAAIAVFDERQHHSIRA